MDSLFGVEVTGAARFIIAFVVVLVLIALTAWLVRRFGSGSLSSAGGRGRQPRLAVIDAASVDARRKLILVRRDNVEHLVMIGGPSDVVIEPNIVRAAAAARDVPAARGTPIPETMPRPVPLEESTMWPLQPEPAPRPQRPAATAAPEWSAGGHQPAEASIRPTPDTLADLANALASQAPPPRIEPRLAVPDTKASAQYATPATDQNLAEMAQRLEAALRRPGSSEIRPAAPAVELPPVEPELTPPAATAASDATHTESTEERPNKPEQHSPGESKKFYETLEQEMASLLGRPTGKT